ncbi:WD repeat and coiled-coil-containing protein isoform X2 [Scyliorhinus canicula]|nr:WD repeat and coiled-coil-containing protein isoform X2 [Scyliorhinus canicula]XP_038656129.1 WD repeat and coiled-coil-containing protein isoform X2 [Scyliorhinus canicula]XP_038656130.1 WD repeat and coiled-coil-containing protein isoform X2 [Scyliorhinus canicula]
MELGKAKLLRTGINVLHQAVHPIHGIAWTDGKQIALTAIYLVNGEVKFGDSNVIGSFDHVNGLHWGPVCYTGALALLAVQHKKHITVWQLQNSTLEHNKLLVSQTCELGEIFPILQQGCVWHPKHDALAVLTKRDASVLFAVQVDNRRVKADIKGSGLIHCACWTTDGNRLVIAVGSALHSYIWNNTQKTLHACKFCPIFDVGGYICAIEACLDLQVVVTTELPLDRICGLNAGITFDVAPMSETGSLISRPTMLSVDENHSMDMRRKSIDSSRSLIEGPTFSSSGPLDLTHLLANHRKSDPSPLIHLKRRDCLTGSGQDSSHLILVKFERKVTTTRKVNIPGILVPDIVSFDPRRCTIAVSSNTCNMILVYSVTPSSMPNIQQIQLYKNERPKGLCFLTEKLLLLLVGRQKSNDLAFLPSSNSDRYLIRLMTKNLALDDASVLPETRGQPGINISGMKKYFENLSQEEPITGKELLLPGNTSIQFPNSRKGLIEEVKNSSSEQSSEASTPKPTEGISPSTSAAIFNYAAEPVNSPKTNHGLGIPNRNLTSPILVSGDQNTQFHTSTSLNIGDNANEKIEQLTRKMEKLYESFTEMKQSLSQISDYIKTGKKSSMAYPPDPSFLYIICQKMLQENTVVDEKRAFTLCEGRLRLSTVQEVFNLFVVEMFHGSNWIVLTADDEGFVPLTFKPKQEIIIRDGRQTTGPKDFPPPPSPTDSINLDQKIA